MSWPSAEEIDSAPFYPILLLDRSNSKEFRIPSWFNAEESKSVPF